MPIQIDYNDPRYAQAAAEILRRHDSGEPEANITSAVRDFLILTGLVRADEVVEENPPAQEIRIVYGGWGAPTAALLREDDAIVDYKLFWVTCKDAQEAYYLLAIINSDVLYEMVTPLMSKGQFGARDLQKQLWKLPIPEFDPEDSLHAVVSEAGRVVRAMSMPSRSLSNSLRCV